MWSPALYPNELCHYGIKDMKWGNRRWQNPDGSLTPAGRIHYGVGNQWADAKGSSTHNKSKGSAGRSRSNSGGSRGISGKDAENVMKGGSNIANNASNIANQMSRAGKRKAREEIDLSGMSNKELHIAINRMALEKQYRDLATSDLRTGYDVASDILSLAGSVAAIGASSALIYSTLKKH